MDLNTILIIVSAVLTGAAALFGFKFEAVKKKLNQAKVLLKEGVDVITVAIDAVGDNKITPEEAEAIKKEAQEAAAALKALLGKEAE